MKMAEDVKVPEGWGRVKLGDVIEIFDNQRIPLDSESRSTIKGYIPYCGATGIIDYINDSIFDGEYVLIAEDGGKFNRFEETAYIMKGKFWANNHVHIVRGKDGILDDRFLMYSVNYQDISYYILGSTREKLNQQLLKSVVIFLPPLPEQRKIVEVLETVDNAIEKTERIIEKYKRIKQGLMQELLTKGIDENGNIRSEETHKFKDSPLGRIPEEWEVVELGKHAFVTKLAGFEYTKFFDYSQQGSVVAIRGINIKNGKLDLREIQTIPKKISEKLPRSKLKKNDIVMSYVGTIGECAIIPEDDKYHLAPNVAKIQLDFKFFNSLYVLYYLYSKKGKKELLDLVGSTTQAALSMSNIRKIKIPLPPLLEQKRIASILSQIDEAIEKEQKYKEKLERIKRGLMEDLLSGKVRVNRLLEK